MNFGMMVINSTLEKIHAIELFFGAVLIAFVLILISVLLRNRRGR